MTAPVPFPLAQFIPNPARAGRGDKPEFPFRPDISIATADRIIGCAETVGWDATVASPSFGLSRQEIAAFLDRNVPDREGEAA